MDDLDGELATIAADWQFEKCPRCLGPLRRFVWDRGSCSRANQAVSVCSLCGSDEAVRVYYTGAIVPVESWPILNSPHEYAPESDPEVAAELAAMAARNAERFRHLNGKKPGKDAS